MQLNKAQIILEGNRHYSDGLWDIPIYKTDIHTDNYLTPDIHPSIYASRKEELDNCTITKIQKYVVKTRFEITEGFSPFRSINRR